jgi:hypothetical protein
MCDAYRGLSAGSRRLPGQQGAVGGRLGGALTLAVLAGTVGGLAALGRRPDARAARAACRRPTVTIYWLKSPSAKR